ncbi:MAG: exopolysaccharide biosynthesis polyprenyl glycosylphosphotransferase [Bdellovibrio sp.]|nr:exopolysaccharide biosynthesis polyprenyl glycosylphosphotransferase [Bdellovibrio sp.]
MRKFSPFLTAKNKIFIMLFDLMMLIFVIAGVYFFRFGHVSHELLLIPALWFIVFLLLVSLYVFGTYDLDTQASRFQMLTRTMLAILIGLVGVVVFNYAFAQDREGLFGRGVLIGSLVVFGGLAILYRLATVQFFNGFRSEFNWLLLIDDKNLQFFESDLGRRGLLGHITFLTEKGCGGGGGSWFELDAYLNRRWSGVICALDPQSLGSDVGQTLMRAKLAGHNVMGLSQFYELHWSKVPVYFLGPEWFIAAESFNLVHHPVGLRIKRLGDLFFSIILLSVFWPVMLFVACAIYLESSGPIIYKQVRTGKDGRLFTIYKFRSMVNNAEKNGAQWAQANDSRMTRIGRFLRLTRLDELPQLFNVFKGDMSFIGPRPERPEFNEMLAPLIPYYNLRQLVRPGITGWAQVCYPYGASIEDAREKLQYDLFYIKYYSFLLDLIILLRTVRVVLMSKGR